MVYAGLLAFSASARAQPSGSATVSMFTETGDGVPTGLAERVDAALVEALRAHACCRSPEVSPASFVDVQLTAGCDGATGECLAAIAELAGMDRVAVRGLRVTESGALQLQVVLGDADRNGEPRAAVATAPATEDAQLIDEIPALVERLLEPETPGAAQTQSAPVLTWKAPPSRPPTGTGAPPPGPTGADGPAPSPSPAEPARSAPAEATSGARTGVGIGPWILGGVGAALVVTGALVGASAERDFDELGDRPVVSRADADGLRSEFDSLQGRATTGNILMAVGGAALAAGVVWLAFGPADDGEPEGAAIGLGAGPGRLALSVRGRL